MRLGRLLLFSTTIFIISSFYEVFIYKQLNRLNIGVDGISFRTITAILLILGCRIVIELLSEQLKLEVRLYLVSNKTNYTKRSETEAVLRIVDSEIARLISAISGIPRVIKASILPFVLSTPINTSTGIFFTDTREVADKSGGYKNLIIFTIGFLSLFVLREKLDVSQNSQYQDYIINFFRGYILSQPTPTTTTIFFRNLIQKIYSHKYLITKTVIKFINEVEEIFFQILKTQGSVVVDIKTYLENYRATLRHILISLPRTIAMVYGIYSCPPNRQFIMPKHVKTNTNYEFGLNIKSSNFEGVLSNSDTLCLVGKNASGKSTILESIAGICEMEGMCKVLLYNIKPEEISYFTIENQEAISNLANLDIFYINNSIQQSKYKVFFSIRFEKLINNDYSQLREEAWKNPTLLVQFLENFSFGELAKIRLINTMEMSKNFKLVLLDEPFEKLDLSFSMFVIRTLLSINNIKIFTLNEKDIGFIKMLNKYGANIRFLPSSFTNNTQVKLANDRALRLIQAIDFSE